jgi:purine-binding chemotaxis protein CheW
MAEVLVVVVGARELAVPTAHVREVAALGSATPLPTGPALVVGLTQLRGQIVPLLDLAPGGGAARTPKPNDALLVVELGAARAALLVDRVVGVRSGGELPLLDVARLFDQLRAEVRALRRAGEDGGA